MGCTPIPGCSGRFLTMHKRRRKKLQTRALIQDHGILDDIHHGQVQRILDNCGLWGFNAFTLETVAGGRSLPVLCVHLFYWYGLLDHFKLDVVRVWKLFTLIEEGYHNTNPYHNSIHATDVTQAMHCFLQEEKIRRFLSPIEIMASLIGAVAHDLDHPGVNQHFLISTSNHLATLYENSSVLENHHWRSTVGCLLESGVAEQLLPYRNELELLIRDLILATDINRQQEFLTKFKKHLDEGTLDLSKTDHRHFILQISLKCADISNPTRPWDISHKWSLKVCDEFFRQGEFERKLNLPVTSICDQQSTSIAKIQTGFFKFVVTPLFMEWHRFLDSNLSTNMMDLLESNRKRWEAKEAAEQAEETHTELSDAEPEIDFSEEEMSKTTSPETLSVAEFVKPTSDFRSSRRQSLAVPTVESAIGLRRHSVPVNMEPLSLPRTIYRRESLPIRRHSPARSESRISSGLCEEDELMRFESRSSILSSGSGKQHFSAEDNMERPLSAENLLPEPSIASMTSCAAASRLSSVLQGHQPVKALTRQQTFPPPQPYIRMRYMSATVEMSTCAETVHEDESRSSSSHSSHENISKIPQYTIPSIAVLSPNNGRQSELLEALATKPAMSSSNKREQEENKEKCCKMAKLTDSGQKENVDPRRMSSIILSKRRGSAPVTLPFIRGEESIISAGGVMRPPDINALRRGSMPADVIKYKYDDGHQEKSNVQPVDQPYNLWQYQRRGSAPTDLPPLGSSERRDLLTRHTSLNGKRRKKQLRRRSSGGSETICVSADHTLSESCTRLLIHRNDIPETLLARRRGSLPIEVLTVGHSVF
ncbi:PREDICTED: uncharacterized protein LOC108561508 isoform X2 [Nicrophorus vespilloides]|uniref:Phosphodiesterase n=1 Tax=Nicrophorus vespilloides TaxID=110193 RepID=A0ABM1MK67_NICVS|nr:PREDICTED: uncharacterized protein LOC108561508 isoform X2 [Nicrophorus vespilloides]